MEKPFIQIGSSIFNILTIEAIEFGRDRVTIQVAGKNETLHKVDAEKLRGLLEPFISGKMEYEKPRGGAVSSTF